MYTYTLCRQTIPPTVIAQHINDCCPTLQTNIFIFFLKKKNQYSHAPCQANMLRCMRVLYILRMLGKDF